MGSSIIHDFSSALQSGRCADAVRVQDIRRAQPRVPADLRDFQPSPPHASSLAPRHPLRRRLRDRMTDRLLTVVNGETGATSSVK
jgi:hypothetical protein